MKISVKSPILNIDGTQVVEPVVENGVTKEGKPLTLADIIMTAMTASLKEESVESGEAMLKRMEIAEKTYHNKESDIEITTEDGTLIKERIRKTFGSVIFYANAHRIIEGSK